MANINLSELLYSIKEQNQSSDVTEFFGFCLAHLKDSQSQNFQDIWALYENGFKEGGFFVEFGATDGKTGSNTYLLEKQYGWKGILAEPNPVWWGELEKNRSCFTDGRCVYTKSGESISFVAAKAADLSTIQGFENSDYHNETRKNSELIKVTTVSLIDLLNRKPISWEENFTGHKTIDYMSVDTEGSEYDILSTFFSDPVSKHYIINCMSIEHNFHPEMREKLKQLMEANGYERVFEGFSRWDDFYRLVKK